MFAGVSKERLGVILAWIASKKPGKHVFFVGLGVRGNYV